MFFYQVDNVIFFRLTDAEEYADAHEDITILTFDERLKDAAA